MLNHISMAKISGWSPGGILLAMLISLTAAADDWPQFLGRQRNGISSETGLLTTFPDAGPPALWSQPVGSGMSGVAVANDSIYTL
ncbi:MAG: hypothetical protein KDA85_19005, partial [Planctomycetaceae bacterium]|nr:hypothetical protein [Planctomycetaceae bacterium]